ncbi:MAG: DUF5615 family PIN-like protein [Phormidesmis sp.]
MRILLDECIDRKLAKEFVGHDVKTVPQMGWASTKDSQLLSLAEMEFDVFVTVDQNIPFEQNLQKFSLAVIILCSFSNRLAELKPLVPLVVVVLNKAVQGHATVVGRQSNE